MGNPYEPIYWSPGESLLALERRVIEKAFQHYRENKSATATSLGITVKTLENKLLRYKEEDDEQAERVKQHERFKEEHLRRARGLPQSPDGSFWPKEGSSSDAETGNGVEPSVIFSEECTVSVPEQDEIQDLLHDDAPKSRPAGTSRRVQIPAKRA